jgi:hypothetical protein
MYKYILIFIILYIILFDLYTYINNNKKDTNIIKPIIQDKPIIKSKPIIRGAINNHNLNDIHEIGGSKMYKNVVISEDIINTNVVNYKDYDSYRKLHQKN